MVSPVKPILSALRVWLKPAAKLRTDQTRACRIPARLFGSGSGAVAHPSVAAADAMCDYAAVGLIVVDCWYWKGGGAVIGEDALGTIFQT